MAELFTIMGKAAMRLATPGDQTIDATTPVILNCDTITVERGGLTASTTTNAITVSKTGLYEFEIGIDVEFTSNDQIDIQAYVNGVAYSAHPAAIQGLGAGKPVSLYWKSTVPLNAGDVVDLRMLNGDAGSFTATFRRVHFAMTSDS